MRLKDLYVSAFQPLDVSRNKARCNTCGLRLLARASKMKMHLIKFHLSLAEEMNIKPTLKKLCRLIPLTLESSPKVDHGTMSPKAIKYFEMQSSDDEGEREMIEARSQPASPDYPGISKRMHTTLTEDEENYHDMVIRRSQPASPDYPGISKRMPTTSSEDENEENYHDMVIRRSQPASPDSPRIFKHMKRSSSETGQNYQDNVIRRSQPASPDSPRIFKHMKRSSSESGQNYHDNVIRRSQPASPDSPRIFKHMKRSSSENEEHFHDMVIRRSQPASPDSPKNFKHVKRSSSDDEQDHHDTIIRRSQPASPEDDGSRFGSLNYEEMILAPSRRKTLDISRFLEYCSSFLDDSLGIFDTNQFINDVKSFTGRDVVHDYILLHTKDESSGIKDVITNELKDKMLTIRYEVSGSKLLVKAVYYCDALRKVITRSLDISTQEHETNELFNALKEYGIEEKFIYSHSLETGNIMSIEHQEVTVQLNTQKIGPLTVMDNAVDECIRSMHLENFLFEIRLLMKRHEQDIFHFNSSLLTCNSWMSIYQLLAMFNRNMNLFGNIEEKWNFVPKFITALELIVELVKTADSKQNLMGDFFVSWLTTTKKLQIIARENIFAFMLFGHLKMHIKKLVEIEDFRSAIYMDPRFNNLESNILTDQDKKMALSHLMKTYKRIQELNPDSESSNTQGFLLKIYNLQFQTKSLFNDDALLNWMQKSDDRELTKLAKVVLVAPATYYTMHCST